MTDTVYIVLFRGVGGQTKLPSKPLREALTGAGFKKVTTYIASGNAVLQSDLPVDSVRTRVAEIAREELDFSKEIVVVSCADWAEVIAGNPFPEAVAAPTTLHVFVLTAAPPSERVAALTAKASPSERVVVRGKVLYFHAPEGFGTSKLPPVMERVLGVSSTARNWNTVMRLAELAEDADQSDPPPQG